jgi:predicted TIM-barrel fold metal-dependent hydrolase
MIIDIHVHMMGEGLPSKAWWDAFYRVSASLSGAPLEKVKERAKGWWDMSGDMLVNDMDAAGIDKSVLLVVDPALGAGTGETISLDEVHRIFAKAVARHPDRLIAFAGVDPRRPEAPTFVERAVKEWNMKGLKLHPAMGFYPNSTEAYRVYSKCLELGIPVLVHTGPEVAPLYSKYGQTIFLDDVANDFPDLKIIIAHAGGSSWPEAASIAGNKPNIWLDLAWWQPKMLRRPVAEFYGPLRSMLDAIGPGKILFGSDWPTLRLVRRMGPAAWVKAFTDIPEEVKAAGITFTEEEIKGILGRNAAKLLGLE